VKENRIKTTPDQLEFEIGGCFGVSHGLELANGELLYLAFEGGSSQPKRQARLNPSPAHWAAFWEAMDQINVWAWRSDYSTPDVLDGTSWSLKLQHAGRTMSSGGDNGYPGGNGPEYSRTSAFAKFLTQLRKLTGVEEIA
jgi:hypothetical protein